MAADRIRSGIVGGQTPLCFGCCIKSRVHTDSRVGVFHSHEFRGDGRLAIDACLLVTPDRVLGAYVVYGATLILNRHDLHWLSGERCKALRARAVFMGVCVCNREAHSCLWHRLFVYCIHAASLFCSYHYRKAWGPCGSKSCDSRRRTRMTLRLSLTARISSSSKVH
jgi:hypothetical protein